jgi:adenine-specific DNA-methyltransferase
LKSKKLGQVFTDEWIVTTILKEVGFFDNFILDKKIIDPACGDGAFLKVIVKYMIKEAKKINKSNNEIKEILERNVYGIEVDKETYEDCIYNLNTLTSEFGISEVNWNIYNEDALKKYKDFRKRFDYVVGNPPYIRVHNLDLKTREFLKKEFKFTRGVIDIYIAFFEIGIEMLKESGVLGYITPNSFLKNSSYNEFRKFLKDKRLVRSLIDFKSNKLFKKFSTYSAITIIDFREKEFFEYKELINETITKINEIRFDNLDNKSWSFSDKDDMEFLEVIKKSKHKIADFFEVQYGFATLRDKIYIGKITKEKENLAFFNGKWVEKAILKKIIKVSTYKNEEDMEYILFPYKENKLIDEEELKKIYPFAYNYLLSNKEELLKRDLRGAKWYAFGRSQGLRNMHNKKIAISPIFKDRVNFHFLDEDVYVYSGIFITKKSSIELDILRDIFESEEFKKFVKIKGKDLSNGYKSITPKIIKEFSFNKVNKSIYQPVLELY